MLETIVVLIIVGVVLVFAAKSFLRTLAGKNDGCGCESKCGRSCACDKLDTETRETPTR